MQNSLLLRDPNLLRFVQDFETLAEVLQTRIDRKHSHAPHAALHGDPTQFTTEWQLPSGAPEAPSL